VKRYYGEVFYDNGIDDETAKRAYAILFAGDQPEADKGNKGIDLNNPRVQRILEDAAHYRTLRDVFRELDRGNKDKE
jgi:hypothetical protein